MSLNPAESNDYEIVSNHHFAEIRKDITTEQKTLFSLSAFLEGSRISPFSPAFISEKASYLTVQIANKKHIALHPYFLQYINHGCNPNCFFDTSTFQVIALRNIAVGEEFTFFYPSTEWEMANTFNCYCNQPKCIGVIKGAAYIPEEILKNYKLSNYIKSKIKYRQRKLKRA